MVWWVCCVWKNCFVENNVARHFDTSGGEVETAIAFMFEGIAEENAAGRARSKLVIHGGIQVWKA